MRKELREYCSLYCESLGIYAGASQCSLWIHRNCKLVFSICLKIKYLYLCEFLQIPAINVNLRQFEVYDPFVLSDLSKPSTIPYNILQTMQFLGKKKYVQRL